jgi:hypothetical protein
MDIDGVMTIGVWSWLDGVTLREALAIFEADPRHPAPVRYLDGPGIPDRYKCYLGDSKLEREPPYIVDDKVVDTNKLIPWRK